MNTALAGSWSRAALLALAASATAQNLLLCRSLGQPNGRTGAAVAGLADVDRDGVPDFAIGSPGHARVHALEQHGAP